MAITLSFFGAAGDVTGSAYLLETSSSRVLVDFGMFQGGAKREALNKLPDGLNVTAIDAVLVTHAHLDHTGRLPLLAKYGYTGPVFATESTAELAALILRDSAFIQSQDLERINRKRERAGKSLLEASYTEADVAKILSQFRCIEFGLPVEVATGITARFEDSGHILGSGSIKLEVRDGEDSKSILFSGDVGPSEAPVLNDPEVFHRADVVIMETTYGNRNHRPLEETVAEFETVIKQCVKQRSKVLLPVFAVGRTQLMLYLLAEMFEEGKVERFPIYVDSPMAVEATKIYRNHVDLFDAEFQELRRVRPILKEAEAFTPSTSREDSMALNRLNGPMVIMAGSGMCTGGRIMHHLKQNLWRPDASVIIVGYQGEGSLGRRLVDGHESVRIFGEEIAVKATVKTMGGFSAHAGQKDLVKWIKPLLANRPRVILTHGEDRSREAFAELMKSQFDIATELPHLDDTIVL